MTSHQNFETPSEPTLPTQETTEATCDKHGTYTARVTDLREMGGPRIIQTCPACLAERKTAEDLAERQRRERERAMRVESILGRSGIPERFRDRSFGNYHAETVDQRVALVACRRFADTWTTQWERGGSLVLTGGPGTGKTHLACAIATMIAEQNLATSAFGTVTQFLRHIKSTYAKDSEKSEQDAIDDLIAPDLLIIDEIGVQVGSDHEKLLLFEVLNERYQRVRPTILISNLNADDLEAYLGHRVMDRYRECGTVIAFNWQSWRGRR